MPSPSTSSVRMISPDASLRKRRIRRVFDGAAGTTRTPRLPLTRRLLYQMSYSGMVPSPRIELGYQLYQSCAFPLSYDGEAGDFLNGATHQSVACPFGKLAGQQSLISARRPRPPRGERSPACPSMPCPLFLYSHSAGPSQGELYKDLSRFRCSRSSFQ